MTDRPVYLLGGPQDGRTVRVEGNPRTLCFPAPREPITVAGLTSGESPYHFLETDTYEFVGTVQLYKYKGRL